MSGQSHNPVISGLYADPGIVRFGDTYYIYPTSDGIAGWGSTSFRAFSSKDLVTWKDEGVILDLANVAWGPSGAWAPCMAERNGRYYFYFVASGQIGVAVGESPVGPFVDALGKPLVAKDQFDTFPIDPAVFVDDDGEAWFYFGNGKCKVVRLNKDMVSFSDTPADITPPNFREGAFVIKRKGKYYLMWSENDTREKEYCISWAVSDSPTGPFIPGGNNPILSQNPSLGIFATGHNTAIEIPGRDEWYIVYHRFAIPDGDGMHRETCIDALTFEADGSIRKVTPTLDGIAPVC